MNIFQRFKQSKFDRAIDSLIEINEKNRGNLKFRKQLADTLYLISICTVHCNAGRNVGKTHYIVTHATNKDLIICYNRFVIDFYRQRYNGNERLNIISVDQIDSSVLRGRNFEKIYVDEPALCFKNYDRFKFYEMLSRQPTDPTIIMLGE